VSVRHGASAESSDAASSAKESVFTMPYMLPEAREGAERMPRCLSVMLCEASRARCLPCYHITLMLLLRACYRAESPGAYARRAMPALLPHILLLPHAIKPAALLPMVVYAASPLAHVACHCFAACSLLLPSLLFSARCDSVATFSAPRHGPPWREGRGTACVPRACCDA